MGTGRGRLSRGSDDERDDKKKDDNNHKGRKDAKRQRCTKTKSGTRHGILVIVRVESIMRGELAASNLENGSVYSSIQELCNTQPI